MSRTRQFLVATGTFSVALGIGFVMQNGDALAARFSEPTVPMAANDGTGASVPVVQARAEPLPGTAAYMVRQRISSGAGVPAVVEPNDTAQAADLVAVNLTPEVDQPAFDVSDLSAPSIEPTPVSLTATDEPVSPAPTVAPVLEAALDTTDLAPPITDAPVAVVPECATEMVATAMPAALVDLVVTAPCFPNAQVAIHHQGMMFSIITDDTGVAQVTVPALAESAVFIADLGNGAGSVAVTTVPDLGTFDRAVLQWQGIDGPEIHALEFGAGYGEDGHVWHGAARSADAAMSGTGGFLVRLGDGQGLNPMMAEIYTYPSGQSAQAGMVEFSVETPVTAANCGTEIAAQSIQVSPGADPFALDLTMTLPPCDAVGEYLVLKNMLLDLTLAAK